MLYDITESNFEMKKAGLAVTVLTSGVVIQQEGEDEEFVDVATVHWISVHETHVSAESCDTAHSETKRKMKISNTVTLCVCVCETL